MEENHSSGDAENVLTVGAIDKKKLLAPFSSIGNTADGRVKPDVVAVGLKADIVAQTVIFVWPTEPLSLLLSCAEW